MQIVESRKMLVFAPNDPDAVVKVIPHAKSFFLHGEEHVAVPHGVEESMVLRNMGLRNAPPPILTYYDWPGRGKPRKHQRETAAFLTSYRYALCLNAPGTGKSLSALWASDFLISEGLIKRVVIVAPKSTLKPVWGHELKHHFPHRSFVILRRY